MLQFQPSVRRSKPKDENSLQKWLNFWTSEAVSPHTFHIDHKAKQIKHLTSLWQSIRYLWIILNIMGCAKDIRHDFFAVERKHEFM